MKCSGVALAFLSAVSSCGSVDHAGLAPSAGGEYRVLFIGNSLTYFNDLPGTVVQLGRSVDDTFQVRSEARPNLALIDHVNGKSDAMNAIQSGGWDYVVLQQGPSALPASRDTLILAARMLDPEIRRAGARSALLMVWPESARFTVFDDVRDSYLLAAQEVGGVFLPVGEAWRAAWALDPELALYGSDGAPGHLRGRPGCVRGNYRTRRPAAAGRGDCLWGTAKPAAINRATPPASRTRDSSAVQVGRASRAGRSHFCCFHIPRTRPSTSM